MSAVSAESGAWSSRPAEKQATDALIDNGGHLRAVVAVAAAWASSRGIALGGVPSLIVNGRLPTRLGGVDLQADGMPLISEDMQTLQKAVAAGTLDDSVQPSVYAAFLGRATRVSAKQARAASRSASSSSQATSTALYSLPGAGTVVPRFNAAIFAAPALQHFVPFSAPEAAPLLQWTSYVGAAGTGDEVKSVSLTIIDDVSSQAGIASLAAALAFVKPRSDAGVSTCFSIDSSSCFALPERFAQDLRKSGTVLISYCTFLLLALCIRALARAISLAVRVGLVHLPALEPTATSRAEDSVGSLISILWSAVTGAAGNGGSGACNAARALGFQV